MFVVQTQKQKNNTKANVWAVVMPTADYSESQNNSVEQ